MPTALWDVRSALVNVFTPVLPDGTAIYDGPRANGTPDSSFLLVGTDGGETGMGEGFDDGATITQRASTLGPGVWRDETGEVVCSVWAWSGSTDLVPLRTTVQTVLDACEGVLIADRTLGGVLVPPGLAEFGGIRLTEVQDPKGAVVRAVFTVAYLALVTP